MQYPVPQFVDVEDKVIGPLTIKQFLWILGGAGITFLWWILVPAVLAVILTIPTVLLAGAFAFYKINGSPFYFFVANLFGFAIKPKIRVWRRSVEVEEKAIPEIKEKKKDEGSALKKVDLDTLVTILDNELSPQARMKPVTNPVEPELNQNNPQNYQPIQNVNNE